MLMVLAAVAGVGLIASRSGSAHDSRRSHDAALVATTTVLVRTANQTAVDIDAARQAAVTVVASTGDVVKAGPILVVS
jgi:hypothetical protein